MGGNAKGALRRSEASSVAEAAMEDKMKGRQRKRSADPPRLVDTEESSDPPWRVAWREGKTERAQRGRKFWSAATCHVGPCQPCRMTE